MMFTARKSIRRQLLQGADLLPLPTSVEFVPEDFRARHDRHFLDRVVTAGRPVNLELHSVYVDRWGVLTRRGLLHPASWDFERNGVSGHLRHAWRWLSKSGSAETIESACFVMPHLMFGGSYGDYWLEKLLPLAYHAPRPGSVVLFFEQRHADFAREDLQELRLQTLLVPEQGLNVRKLTILVSPQYYDNFTAETVDRLKHAFRNRCHESRIPGKKIHLSRVGYARERGGPLNRRVLGNARQIEDFLAGRGFEILRPHEMENEEVRTRLCGAEVVVAEHGAAMFHLFWSPPEILVELVAEGWFSPCFVKMTPHLPVKRHVVIAASSGGNLPMHALHDALASA